MSARVFVGNLSFQTTRDQVVTLLSAAGSIVDAYFPTDRETGRPRGFAFVRFSNETEAADAIQRFNGIEVDGRKLTINVAEERPRPARGFSPSQPMGATREFAPYGGRPPAKGKGGRPKGSRRGLRGRKRSL